MRKMIVFLILIIAIRNYAQQEETLKYVTGNDKSHIFLYFGTYIFTDKFNNFYYVIIPKNVLKSCDNVYKFVKDKEYFLRLYKVTHIYELTLGFSLSTDKFYMDGFDKPLIYSKGKFLIDFYYLVDYYEIK
jgi:hypothetical protein